MSAIASRTPAPSESVASSGLAITVFLIEHDAAVRDSLAASLEAAGLVVRAYESAAAFIDDFECIENACIVLDLDLPETDVRLLSQRFGATQVSVPTVTTSGRLRMETRQGCTLASGLPPLQKPFGDTQLIEVIMRAVDKDGLNTPARGKSIQAT